MNWCSACGSPQRDGVQFCGSCGQSMKSIDPSEAPTETIHTPTAPPTAGFSCGACGTINRDEAQFCSNCGAEFVDVSVGRRDRKRTALPLYPLAAGVVLLLLGGGLWWLVLRDSGEDSVAEDPRPSTTAMPTTPSVPASSPAESIAAAPGSPPVEASAPEDGIVDSLPPTAVPVNTTMSTAPTTVTTTTALTLVMESLVTSDVPTPPVVAPAVPPPPGPITVPGDLAIGVDMTRPPCDGQFVTAVGATTDPAVYSANTTALLDRYPGSEYLRTDQTCPSLRPAVDDNAIYMVYFGPFSSREEACAARSSGPSDAYVKTLSRSLPFDHQVDC